MATIKYSSFYKPKSRTRSSPLNPTPVPVPQVTSHSEQQHRDWHNPQINGPEATVMVGCLAAIVAVIGWVVVHRTALTREREARAHSDRRDKEARRAELLSILKRWEGTFMVVLNPTDLAKLYYEGGGMAALSEASARFRGYIADQETFDRLDQEMSRMHPTVLNATGTQAPRDKICDAIRRFCDFIRTA